jgi:hypothetical protein
MLTETVDHSITRHNNLEIQNDVAWQQNLRIECQSRYSHELIMCNEVDIRKCLIVTSQYYFALWLMQERKQKR